MKSIGFVGTAKNTGKTTTALHVLAQARAAGLPTALTSIGFDGESLDHITGLPKPRYWVEPGDWVASAQTCLQGSTARFDTILPTGLSTILGEVQLARAASAGYALLAGPNRRVDLQQLLAQIRGLDVAVTLVDGALNRLAALTAADGVVLSTGAAFNEQIAGLATHAAALEGLFHLPEYAAPAALDAGRVALVDAAGRVQYLQGGSVLDGGTARQIADWLAVHPSGTCLTPGVFDPHLFTYLLGQVPNLQGACFVFGSPLHLLASGSPLDWQISLAEWSARGGRAACLRPARLYFMTVNPFYPHYLQKTGQYTPAYVDKTELLQACRRLIHATPVLDMFQPPLPDVLKLCGLT